MKHTFVLLIITFGLGIVLFGIIFTIRSLYFVAQTKKLVNVAARFPGEYSVGTGENSTALVVMGDSTGVGIGTYSHEHTLGYQVATAIARPQHTVAVHNLSVNGARLNDVLTSQIPKLPKGKIDYVLLEVSANDATHGTDVVSAEATVKAIYDALKERGVHRVVITSTPDYAATPALPPLLRHVVQQRAQRLSTAIRRSSTGYDFVTVANVHDEGRLPVDEYAADGFHPSEAGYQRWSEIIQHAFTGH